METEQIVIIDGALDEFLSVKPGEPFRLFKYGDIYKGGKKRTVSRDHPFKLPHFKPPIKLGSHKDETPAGGFITGLESRDDGVWAIPELNEEGIKAFESGAYRYHSPEVIWEEGAIEDPDTGKLIDGPLIVGVALCHTPHLGESTALYTYQQEQNMTEQMETVAVPKDFWEGVKGFFKKEDPAPIVEQPTDDFTAVVAERDDYKTKFEHMQAIEAEKELFASIRAEFKTEEYGTAFSALAEDESAVDMLAKMDEPVRAWVLEKFAALSAQAEAVTDEIGEDNPLPDNGVEGYMAAITAYIAEHEGADFVSAATAVAVAKPELYAAYKGGK